VHGTLISLNSANLQQSVIALSKLYSLNDPRLAQTMVKGDLIVAEDDGRIKTRSRAKQSMSPDSHHPPTSRSILSRLYTEYMAYHPGADTRYSPPDPDRYTVVPASLKIIKVLIEELVSASGARAASNAAAAAVAAAEFDDDDGDDGWEDDDDTLDLSRGATKADLMSFMEGGQRERDDETQAYLTDFFIKAARENVANFQEWYNNLTDDEKGALNELANAAGQ
jgi:importin-9